MNILSLRSLEVRDRQRTLLQLPSLDLHASRCTALVGESGSGKSLTVQALLGLLPIGLVATGYLVVDGNAIALGSPAHRALAGHGLAWVPQDPLASLHPLKRVGAQLAETLRAARGLAKAPAIDEARALLDRVQVPDSIAALRRFPHEFFGGQRQRIAIALALATRPRVLVADEPTAALDARIARDVLRLLDRLREDEGLAVLLVSHDLPLVAAHAEQVLVLRRGEVVEQGATADVLSRPAHAYTRELVASGIVHALDAPHAAGDDADIVLEARDLRLRYPGAPRDALDGVDLVLRRGEALAIVGESGSGKSSLGRVLLRLVRHARGEVRLHQDGRVVDLLRLPPRELRHLRRVLGIVFQDPYASLDPRMRVLDLVTEPLRIHGERDAAVLREKAGALMRQVGLDAAMLDRHPHAFSGGQRQRIAIARALAGDPVLLLCDEAVSALDAHHRRAILQLLTDLKRERGLSLLFITHDLAGAALLAERIAVMEHGRIVETGATREVLASPKHAHTRALLGLDEPLAVDQAP
ncbi:ATP-binding cassette domain-containing protein [Cognatilysobacter lacus]|uniref:ABC transporter ATP-binding protein n=1 Tax=Cognatilysobacter lacus TaxID=1643323 RepID=A0A5D8YYR1_9GAMM|nr:ABC transporter ATP-binding protein [Lysobacter lacus]TZF87868.1 ABC transporter ATP-binding protein [Lysobacter lacus]